jgi:hypothetical protein
MNCGMDVCQAGACVPNDGGFTVPDAGPRSPIGGACTGQGTCAPGSFCIPEMGPTGPTGFTGGDCVAQCGMGATCPMGSTCVVTDALGFSGSVCLGACDAMGGCRSGYVCAMPTDGGSPYCAANCTNGNLAACPMGQTCDMTSGLCH